MGQDAQTLGAELWEAYKGRNPSSRLYESDSFDDLAGTLDSPGSANKAPLAHGTRLYVYQRTNPARFAEERQAWVHYFEQSRWRWMGREVGSRIYFPWHVLPVLMVRELAKKIGDSELESMAWAWLAFASAWMVAVTTPWGHPLWIGQRSAGHGPDLPWLKAYAAFARGKPIRYRGSSWEDKAILALAPLIPIMADVTQAFTALRSFNFRTLCPVYLLETEAGLSVWMPKNINGNTQPVLLAVARSVGKLIAWFPKNCGMNTMGHRAKGSMTVTREGHRFLCESVVYGEDKIQIPEGMAIRFVSWGGAEGYTDLLERFIDGREEPPNTTSQKRYGFLRTLLEKFFHARS